MSQDILSEVEFFTHSLLLGVVITFVYDWFLILRRSIKHNMLAVSLEDMVFWISCAIGVFYMLYEENNGILRWFAVLGAALGMLLYKKLISGFFVDLMSTCIIHIFRFLSKLFWLLWRPIRFVIRKLGALFQFIFKKSKKVVKCFKKKLTVSVKLLKITLYKQKAPQKAKQKTGLKKVKTKPKAKRKMQKEGRNDGKKSSLP